MNYEIIDPFIITFEPLWSNTIYLFILICKWVAVCQPFFIH